MLAVCRRCQLHLFVFFRLAEITFTAPLNIPRRPVLSTSPPTERRRDLFIVDIIFCSFDDDDDDDEDARIRHGETVMRNWKNSRHYFVLFTSRIHTTILLPHSHSEEMRVLKSRILKYVPCRAPPPPRGW